MSAEQLAGNKSTQRDESPDATGSGLLIPRSRFWLALLALLAVQGVVWAARSFSMPTSSRPPNRPLEELPIKLGSYEGTDVEPDPRVAEFLGTDSSVSREYKREADGRTVMFHAATWDGAESWAPHPPEGCYTSGGWVERSSDAIELSTEPPMRAKILTFERQGQQVRVLYSFRLGQETFLNRSEAREARRQFWGARQWPPVVKILLQTNTSGDADEALKEFALLVDEWTRQL